MSVLHDQVLEVRHEFGEFDPSLVDAVLPEAETVGLTGLPEAVGAQEKFDEGFIEGLLAYPESRLGLAVGVVEVDDGDIHLLGHFAEVVVVEPAHFATLVLAASEVLLLGVLEGPLVKQLLVLVRPLLGALHPLLHLVHHVAVLLAQLLDLDIVQLVVVQELAEDDVQVGRQLLLAEERQHFVGAGGGLGGVGGRGQVAQRKTLKAGHEAMISRMNIKRTLDVAELSLLVTSI